MGRIADDAAPPTEYGASMKDTYVTDKERCTMDIILFIAGIVIVFAMMEVAGRLMLRGSDVALRGTTRAWGAGEIIPVEEDDRRR